LRFLVASRLKKAKLLAALRAKKAKAKAKLHERAKKVALLVAARLKKAKLLIALRAKKVKLRERAKEAKLIAANRAKEAEHKAVIAAEKVREHRTPAESNRLNWLSRREYKHIRQYTRALLLFTLDTPDEDGRPLGLDYGEIMKLTLKKFPIVTYPGPHRGLPTKISYKELGKISCDLNQDGLKLPFRHRAKK
jgi:hypothetical protein